MTTSRLRDRMVQWARVVPPIARLHDERNALLRQVAALEQAQPRQGVTALPSPDVAPERPADEARVQLAAEQEKRRQGLVIELDYPCLPRVRSWDAMRGGNVYRRMIESGEERYRALLSSFLAGQDAFTKISVAEPADERAPYWSNPWFPVLDAICLSGLVTKLNPRRYVEVGSGNSTKYVRRAISDHGLRTRVTSIDPYPRAVVDDLCDDVIRDKLENCDLQLFADLGPEDVVFIDNSHRSFQGSDVTVFFTEVLPLLKSGCHYGIHDIFLPYDYPAPWLSRYYNEQYLLMAYLAGGANGDEIILPVHHVERTPALLETLAPLIRHPALGGIQPLGGAFWMRRR
jgi:hypothetical protein